jgi:hypothetical protein
MRQIYTSTNIYSNCTTSLLFCWLRVFCVVLKLQRISVHITRKSSKVSFESVRPLKIQVKLDVYGFPNIYLSFLLATGVLCCVETPEDLCSYHTEVIKESVRPLKIQVQSDVYGFPNIYLYESFEFSTILITIKEFSLPAPGFIVRFWQIA